MPKKTTPKPAAADQAPASEAPTRPEPPKGKLGTLVGLLSRESGATLKEMTEATGWMSHSVRGALAGAMKKRLKLTVTSARREDGVRVWRVSEPAQ